MNPMRKLRLELKQMEIVEKLATGGLDTHAEDEEARQKVILWTMENVSHTYVFFFIMCFKLRVFISIKVTCHPRTHSLLDQPGLHYFCCIIRLAVAMQHL